MADIQNIRGLDKHGESRDIHGYGLWTPWRSPNDWNNTHLTAIGNQPGVYMVRAIDDKSHPIIFECKCTPGTSGAAQEELHKRAQELQGILYIGKTVSLQSRFTNLVESWTSNPPTDKHTSAKNYLERDKRFHQTYPPNRIMLRCKPIGTKDWADKALRDGLLGLSQEWFWKNYPEWTQGHGNSHIDQTCAATIASERSLLCHFYHIFGEFPQLNKDVPDCHQDDIDQEWPAATKSNAHDPGSEAQADDVQFLDKKNTHDAQMIESARRKAGDNANETG